MSHQYILWGHGKDMAEKKVMHKATLTGTAIDLLFNRKTKPGLGLRETVKEFPSTSPSILYRCWRSGVAGSLHI
jgi:hypothetical protein